MSKKVDLFCVGSAKAGTTSLHRLLEKNGIISQTKYKEPHFFTNSKIIEKVLCDNIEEYEKNFLESSKTSKHDFACPPAPIRIISFINLLVVNIYFIKI